MSRLPGGVAALLPVWTGVAAAALHGAGALKSLPGLAALPFDLTAAAALLLLPALPLLLATRRWTLGRGLAVPLLGALLLLLWLVLAGTWSPSRAVLAEKLPQLVLLGPAMLAAGFLVGAEPAALGRFCGAALALGLLVGGAVAWGVAADRVVLGGEPGADPGRVRVQYQLAGLAIATAAALAAVRAVEARGAAGRLFWLALTAVLALAVLVPGGRLALLGLLAAVALAPALLLWRRGRRAAALAWVAGVGLAAIAGLAALAARPGWVEGLRTLERLFGDPASATPARLLLWERALRWGGLAAPFGLGTAGFTIAAGFGEDRGFYPHNHALEALAEGGLPGLGLWLAAFGGGAVLALRQARHVPPGRAARVAAVTLPVALSAMVSTDLGNRMVWFALGLLLSLAAEARAPEAEAGGG
ncbi:O-antigen ligase family protein [Crenalkalicoccus roseus]|uniref:O-antigen ligase family protein n=1 Tax=Crenalkalicoccus roseus TaxID=1485588 RepID=UPI00108018F1|nr:O-antigen ligase family protein [Crenalkalicoccus roseus]